MSPRFFGYGSLVNLATHDFPDARPATLQGWRRVWRHSTLREVAFLSVEPAEDHQIDGVTAQVPGADWTDLDERERAYIRRDVTHLVTHDSAPAHTAVYEVHHGHLAPPDTAHPILLSYIDVVVQGYLRLYGRDGALRFAETTEGWHAPVLNDRADPIYSRHQPLDAWERDWIDGLLSDLAAMVEEPEERELALKRRAIVRSAAPGHDPQRQDGGERSEEDPADRLPDQHAGRTEPE